MATPFFHCYFGMDEKRNKRNGLMSCTFGHSLGRDREEKAVFVLSIPFDWLPSPGSHRYHVEMTHGKCSWSLSKKKNVAKGTRSAVWGYLNLSYVSDHTRCSFSLRTARLSLRVDYRQLIVEVVQTKVSLCQSHFIFSFARKPFPSLFLTHTLRLDPYVY